MPSMREIIASVAAQPREEARVSLTCLANINWVAGLVVQDIDADLFSKIDFTCAASSFEGTLIASAAPKNMVATALSH